MPSYQEYLDAEQPESEEPEVDAETKENEGEGKPGRPSATRLNGKTATAVPGKPQRRESTLSSTEVPVSPPSPATSTACPSPFTHVRAKSFPAIPASWSVDSDASVKNSDGRSADSAVSQVPPTEAGDKKRKASAARVASKKRPASAKAKATSKREA